MKRSRHLIMAVGGVLLCALGFYLILAAEEPAGLLKTLPYVLIGLGCGTFGYGVGELLRTAAMRKHPEVARQVEIESTDERNIMLGNLAKSRGYDMMSYVFGALMVAYALMGAPLSIVIPFVIAYLFVHGYAVYQRIRAEKNL